MFFDTSDLHLYKEGNDRIMKVIDVDIGEIFIVDGHQWIALDRTTALYLSCIPEAKYIAGVSSIKSSSSTLTHRLKVTTGRTPIVILLLPFINSF